MLVRCHKVHGGTTILQQHPRCDTYHDVMYVPLGAVGSSAGIYDRGRKLVTSAGFFRGIPHVHPVFESYVSGLDPGSVPMLDSDLDYVYVGHVSQHYGHFLVSCLSRYWRFADEGSWNAKFLYLDQLPPEELFRLPFIAAILSQLGLGPTDFVSFKQPVRLSKLTIPAPSFEENNFAHVAFARLCHRIGDSISKDRAIARTDSPVYMSKSRLHAGVGRVVNEEEVCSYLSNRGVEIIYPETLDFGDQVAAFRRSPLVCGTSGSALHTGIFTPKNNLVILNHDEQVWSNQLLLDGINDNQSLYLYPKHGIINEGKNQFFGNNFLLADPSRTASEFLRAIDAFMAAKNIRPRAWDPVTPADGLPKLVKPEGKNLARGKPTLQSSHGVFSFGQTAQQDSAGAVSGLLTGFYQFHTEAEAEPWWQVDLLCSSSICEIRIYNRLDVCAERASKLVISAGEDEHSLTVLCARDEEVPFGGLDGHPFIWKPPEPVVARLVRIQLPVHTCLHLDQVEIYGWVEA